MRLLTKLTSPIKVGKLYIHISSVLLFGLAFVLGFWQSLIAAYTLAALHELAHILAARRLGVGVSGVELLPFGVSMRLLEDGIKSPADEIKISIAGPAASLLTAYLCYGVYRLPNRDFVILSALSMAVFNLLPVMPLDGGRIFRAALVKRYGCIRAASCSRAVSKLFAVLVVLCGVWLLYRTGFNFSLILIGGFLIASITEERKNTDLVIIKDILYSRKKLVSSGVMGSKLLVASEDSLASKVLKELSYESYALIGVVDSNDKITSLLSETEFVAGLSVCGTDSKVKKIVELML